MGINLSKGARIDLSKEAPSLAKVGVGLGWTENSSDTKEK
jgi:tellurium resistance protein TerD